MFIDDNGNITIGNNEIIINNVVRMNSNVKKQTVNVNTKNAMDKLFDSDYWKRIKKLKEQKGESKGNKKECECEKCKWFDISQN